jgi:hypothetical protein
MIGELICFAYCRGYEMSLGRGRVSVEENERQRGHKGSLHMKGLAQDLNLFKDGKYLTKTQDHQELGEFWESIGGTWGGRWGDGNHYSFEFQGMK